MGPVVVPELVVAPEMDEADDDLLNKLRADHPGDELILYRSGNILGVFRSPPYQEWKRFRTMYTDPAKRADALETLVMGCLVFPTATELRARINRRPALYEAWGSELAAAAGMGAEVVEKK